MHQPSHAVPCSRPILLSHLARDLRKQPCTWRSHLTGTLRCPHLPFPVCPCHQPLPLCSSSMLAAKKVAPRHRPVGSFEKCWFQQNKTTMVTKINEVSSKNNLCRTNLRKSIIANKKAKSSKTQCWFEQKKSSIEKTLVVDCSNKKSQFQQKNNSGSSKKLSSPKLCKRLQQTKKGNSGKIILVLAQPAVGCSSIPALRCSSPIATVATPPHKKGLQHSIQKLPSADATPPPCGSSSAKWGCSI